MDETRLIEQVQAGSLPAYEQLMQLYIRRVRGFVALRLPIPQAIDEITHETLVFAYHRIHEFEAGTNFWAWLKAIAHNLVRAEMQRYAREQANRERYRQFRLTADPKPERVRPELAHLDECLADMPENSRRLIDLKYALGHSTQEIAAAMEKSSAWVRTTLFRLRQALRECIEERALKEAGT